jgi:hypothetical protein
MLPAFYCNDKMWALQWNLHAPLWAWVLPVLNFSNETHDDTDDVIFLIVHKKMWWYLGDLYNLANQCFSNDWCTILLVMYKKVHDSDIITDCDMREKVHWYFRFHRQLNFKKLPLAEFKYSVKEYPIIVWKGNLKSSSLYQLQTCVGPGLHLLQLK